jgi:hypothetical protein
VAAPDAAAPAGPRGPVTTAPQALPRTLRWLLRPLGGWRSGLTWRIYGWALVQLFLMKVLLREPAAYWAQFPGSYHLLVLSGALLVVFGPRRVLLLTAASGALLAWWSVVLRTHPNLWFPAAEWPLVAGYPVIGCAGFLLARRGHLDRDFESAALGGVRALGGAALFAAAFHKVNRDFFDPAVSCIHLRDLLAEWWRLPPAALSWITPGVIIALEAVGAALFWIAPALGCLLVALLSLQFGLSTATGFAALIMTAGVAGLPEDAGPALRAAWRRHRKAFLTVVAGIVATGALAYRGPRPWLQFAVFQVGAAVVVASSVAALVRRRAGAVPAATSPPWRVRAFVAAVLAAALFNASRPYLGLGFEYGFAMLSNLRTDSDRWNSLIVPRPAGLETDDYLHVHGVRYFPAAPGEPPILPALHSPEGLKRKLALLHTERPDLWVGLDFTYRDRAYRYSDGQRRAEMLRVLLSIPDRPLLQEQLVLGGPQVCTH